MNFNEDIYKYAEFENKVRYSHLDQKLCDLDDELKQLEIDRLCTELDIEIADVLESDTEELYDELSEIEEKIERVEHEYEVVSDFYDKELIEIIESYDSKKKLNSLYEEIVERLFF